MTEPGCDLARVSVIITMAALRQRPQEVRELSSAAIEWDGAAAVKAKSGRLTFAEIYRRVHKNEVDGMDFQFGEFTQAEKEHLIMRGAPLSAVMRDRAAQFASSTSGDSEFKLSGPVAACDDFLSHAWQTDRLQKWMALMYTYNLKASAGAWLIAHVLGMLYCHATAPANPRELSYLAMVFVAVVVVPLIVQLVVLVYGLPRVRSINSEPVVFLDKVCINQCHSGLKTLGINGLETFLKYSKRMVLLYDESTYTRLWCAFESAMFSKYAAANKFVFTPCATARFAIHMLLASHAATFFGCIIMLVLLDWRGWDSSEVYRGLKSRDHMMLWLQTFGVAMLGPYTWMACLLLDRCREIMSIKSSLANFSLKTTHCFEPKDRELVEARIKEAWGDVDKFDTFVKTQLSREMSNNIGAADWP